MQKILLPIKLRDDKKVEVKETYEKMGIKLFNFHTDGFLEAELPNNLTIKSHDEGSDLKYIVDSKNRIRAVYLITDSVNWVDFPTRYQREAPSIIDPFTKKILDESECNKVISEIGENVHYGIVIDGYKWDEIRIDDIIYKTEYVDNSNKAFIAAGDWLDANYPDWKNIHAYWN